VRLQTCVFSIVAIGEQPPNRDNCAVVGDAARDLSAEHDAHSERAAIAGPRARPKSSTLWSGQWCDWRCAFSMSLRIRSDDPLSRCSNFMRAPMLTVCGAAGGGFSRAAGCGRARAPRTPCGLSPTCPTASPAAACPTKCKGLATPSHAQTSKRLSMTTCTGSLGGQIAALRCACGSAHVEAVGYPRAMVCSVCLRREELHAAAGGGPARQAGRVAEPDPEVRSERVRAA